MSKISAEQFWQFSLSTYANEQVQTCLLHWQNDYSVNVNVCLLLAFLDCRQLAVSKKQICALCDAISGFDNNAIKPFRTVRAHVKSEQHHFPHYAQLRQQMLAVELEFEKYQQAQLISACQAMDLPPTSQPNNLHNYLPSELIPLNTDLDQALHSIQY